jgi:hypothetical protein
VAAYACCASTTISKYSTHLTPHLVALLLTDVQDSDYVAVKSLYEHIVELQGRHVWVGELDSQVYRRAILQRYHWKQTVSTESKLDC